MPIRATDKAKEVQANLRSEEDRLNTLMLEYQKTLDTIISFNMSFDVSYQTDIAPHKRAFVQPAIDEILRRIDWHIESEDRKLREGRVD